jgi:pimeloyl-ACP methyl ester carboxylesterase
MHFTQETHTVNGVKVAMLTAGSGDPLVFWHGAGTATGFDFALPWAERFRVMIPYHPGWGDSSDAPDLATPRDYMLHYMDLFDQLALDKITLVGFSMGGCFAATFAVEHGDRLRKLVLIAPAGLVVPEHPLADLSQVPPQEIPRYLVHDFSVIEKYYPQTPDNEFQAARAREGGNFGRMLEAGLIGPWLERWLHRVKVPTMVVWGEKDRIVPVEQSVVWQRLIPQSRVLRVPHAGHMPMQEDPSVPPAIADFLA